VIARQMTEAECAAIAAMIHALPVDAVKPFTVPDYADCQRITAEFLAQMVQPVTPSAASG
jgi:hypothetical protein